MVLMNPVFKKNSVNANILIQETYLFLKKEYQLSMRQTLLIVLLSKTDNVFICSFCTFAQIS